MFPTPLSFKYSHTFRHILSNVGRVASRDSSRNSATAQDLFVALCEDHSIYSLFKTMKGTLRFIVNPATYIKILAVYEQIEQLSKAPRVRRSKSFTRNDKIARTSSPHQDLSAAKDGSTARSRLSSEGPGMTTTPANPGSRSSFDKTRAMKMFMANSKSSALPLLNSLTHLTYLTSASPWTRFIRILHDFCIC